MRPFPPFPPRPTCDMRGYHTPMQNALLATKRAYKARNNYDALDHIGIARANLDRAEAFLSQSTIKADV